MLSDKYLYDSRERTETNIVESFMLIFLVCSRFSCFDLVTPARKIVWRGCVTKPSASLDLAIVWSNVCLPGK
jgi:hypothetical protein